MELFPFTRSQFVGLAVVLCFPLHALMAHDQVPSPQTASAFPQHPLSELINSQPGEADEYKLGGGDVISVTVVGRSELSGLQTVGPDGRITIPSAGSLIVGNLTRDVAAQKVTDTLKVLYINPIVTVQINKYGSNQVNIIGDVVHPGRFAFDGPPTLLGAIALGGPLIASDRSQQRMPTSCTVYRGTSAIGPIDLKDVRQDIRLQRDDTIYIPGDQQRLISVLGEVNKPGHVVLQNGSTLVSLIADAGGITPQAGNPTIQVFNPQTGTIQKASFKDLLHSTRNEVTLAVGDIIYVPRSGIASVGFFLQQISPAAEIGTIGSLVSH